MATTNGFSSAVVDIATVAYSFKNFTSITGLALSEVVVSLKQTRQFQIGIFPKPPKALTAEPDDVLIYLWTDKFSKMKVVYEVYIMGNNHQKSYSKTFNWDYDPAFQQSRNITNFIMYNALVTEANGFLKHNGSLNLFCDIKILEQSSHLTSLSSHSSLDTSVLSMHESLLYAASDHHSDVTLTTHRSILTAQSPVFGRMFEPSSTNNSHECRPGRVEITDLPVEAVELMLGYMNTGQMPSMDQFGVELLTAADKYQLDSLKQAASAFLGASLTVDSVAGVLQLADRHQAEELKAKCVQFIGANRCKVKQTEQWKQLRKENPLLALDSLEQLFFKSE